VTLDGVNRYIGPALGWERHSELKSTRISENPTGLTSCPAGTLTYQLSRCRTVTRWRTRFGRDRPILANRAPER